jgi:hypothetical protein
MKKILVALAMFPMVAAAHDLAPGTFELSGGSNLGLNGGSVKTSVGGVSDTTDTSNYALSATGLYYVMPNFGVGLTLDYAADNQKFSDGTKDNLSSFLLGPAVSFEVPLAPQFSFFGRGDIGYVSATRDTGVSVNATGWGLGLEAGVKYFPVKVISFDAGLGYQYRSVSTDQTPAQDITTTGFGLNLGLSVYFGGGEGHR